MSAAPIDHFKLTHCPQGHPYDGANTFVSKGYRECRTCIRARNRTAKRARTAVTEEERRDGISRL